MYASSRNRNRVRSKRRGGSGGGGGSTPWSGTVLEVNSDGGAAADEVEFGQGETVYTGAPSARYSTLAAALSALGSGDQSTVAIVFTKAGSYACTGGAGTQTGFHLCASTSLWTTGTTTTSGASDVAITGWSQGRMNSWTGTGLTLVGAGGGEYTGGGNETLTFYSCTYVQTGSYGLTMGDDNTHVKFYNSILYITGSVLWYGNFAKATSSMLFENCTILKTGASGSMGGRGAGMAVEYNGCIWYNCTPPSGATGDYNAADSATNLPGGNSSSSVDSAYFVNTTTDAHCASNAKMVLFANNEAYTRDVDFTVRSGNYAGADYVAA
jgi:hypothetical protein